MQELIKASTAADGVLLLTLNRPEKKCFKQCNIAVFMRVARRS